LVDCFLSNLLKFFYKYSEFFLKYDFELNHFLTVLKMNWLITFLKSFIRKLEMFWDGSL
jgi:hypothetical protein